MWNTVKGWFWFACLVMFILALYNMGALDSLFVNVPSVTVQ